MADLSTSWHIPRPTLARGSTSSQGSNSSKNSTQSTKSGTLLLTAANLAQIHDATSNRDTNLQLYLQQTSPIPANGAAVIPAFHVFPKTPEKTQDLDNVSIASSMHFTVVNVNQRTRAKQRSCCSKHQLTILVITMSTLFLIGIISAIFFIEMRARRSTYP